jgi:hypothetical protein
MPRKNLALDRVDRRKADALAIGKKSPLAVYVLSYIWLDSDVKGKAR